MQARMSMAEAGDKNAPNGVEVPFAFDVPIVETIGFIDDQRLVEKLGGLLKVDVRVFEEINLSWSQFHGCAGSPTIVKMASSGRSNSTEPFFGVSVSVLTQFSSRVVS